MDLKFRLFIAGGLLLFAGLWPRFHVTSSVPLQKPLNDFPIAVHGWLMVSNEKFTPDILAVLKPTDYLSRGYAMYDGSVVYLYIGYYGGGSIDGEIHSPKHCLPGSGFYADYSHRVTRDIAGDKINMVHAVYQKGQARELMYYWYQIHGRTINDEFSLKFAEIADSLLNRQRDAAFIKISLPVSDSMEISKIRAERFLLDFTHAIKAALPKL